MTILAEKAWWDVGQKEVRSVIINTLELSFIAFGKFPGVCWNVCPAHVEIMEYYAEQRYRLSLQDLTFSQVFFTGLTYSSG